MFQIQGPQTGTRTVTTAHIAQTMTFLNMSSEEVKERVESEVAMNPALEYIDDRLCPYCHRSLGESGYCRRCIIEKNPNDENIFFVSPRSEMAVEYYQGSGFNGGAESEPDLDSAQPEALAEYVLRQIGADLEEDQKLIAAYLLTGLDEDGFLTTMPSEIAQYYHIPVSDVLEVIEIIQRADPLGVGTTEPKEAMLIQLAHLANVMDIPYGTEEVIRESYDDLIRRRSSDVMARHGLTQRQLEKIEKFLGANLNPYPARSGWGERGFQSQSDVEVYHFPDVIISYHNGEPENQLVVEIVMPISGYLRVSPAFKKELKNASEEKFEEWKKELDRASLLVKSLDNRNNTMEQLLRAIVRYQEQFIRNGESELVPITRAEIAKELDVHESTISRAVSNKSVMLPNRKVVPLSIFFDRSLNVRSVIRDLIRDEKTPLTDARIVEILGTMGIDIARRTVAKYRAMEGILPARLRKASRGKER